MPSAGKGRGLVMAETVAAVDRVPIKAAAAGRVVAWRVAPGVVVQKYDVLGEFDDGAGGVELTAPAHGVVGKTVAAGAVVPSGAILCYITISNVEGQNAPKPLQAATRSAAVKGRTTADAAGNGSNASMVQPQSDIEGLEGGGVIPPLLLLRR